ncbi:Uncharacterised protein [Klebsiella pneumoniae subsp. pneumoniae]|uniref:Uncharacterized protein n=1 Tax=Klebsiella pneumoniae subsp. pneumoniae TaxID=72407 RepID=A0A377ZAY9_KLEPN|nr:Uncharacterised protein [Klebsiella pneumoniae subsp. pneumoniae]
MEILPLTVDSHRPLGNAHHAFNAPHWRQPGPFEQADGVKNVSASKIQPQPLIALAIVEMAAPALVFRQAERGEAGSGGMAVGVLRARGSGAVFRRGSSSRARSILPWIADTLRRSPPQRCHQSASARALSAVSRSLLFATMMSAAAS